MIRVRPPVASAPAKKGGKKPKRPKKPKGPKKPKKGGGKKPKPKPKG